MSYLTELLAEYAVMGGRRGDDPPLDSDDMFDFDLKSDSCSCSECGGNCSCEENNCSECGIQFEDDDEPGMNMEPDMDSGAKDNGMRRRDDDERDMEPGDDDERDMEPGDDMDMDMDMEPGDDMGGDVETRLDDLESKLNDVLKKFAQVIAQDMTNDMEPGDDDLDMEPGDDDLGADAGGDDDLDMEPGDDDLGADAGGDDDLDMGADLEKEGRDEFDMDAFDDDEFEPTGDGDDVFPDEPVSTSNSINPEIRRKIDRMKDEKELRRLLMSGKIPKGMSFKETRKFMREYRDNLPGKVNQDDYDNEVDGEFNTDTYGNREGQERLNKRYRKHRVAETGRGEDHEWGYDEPDLEDMIQRQYSGEYVQHPRDRGKTITHIFRNGQRIDAYKAKTVAMR